MESNLAFLQKVKHRGIIWLNKSTPSYLAKKNENICTPKNRYMNVHSRVTSKIHKQMSKWKNVVRLFNGILFGHKKLMKYGYMLHHRWTFNILHEVKEARHKGPHIYLWFHSYEKYRADKSIATESKLVLTRSWERVKRWGVTVHGYRFSFWRNGNTLKLGSDEIQRSTELYTY